MPCWCRFGHSETRIFKETAWCKNWNVVAMSRGADVGGLLSEPTSPATSWSVFCTLSRPTLRSSLASWLPFMSLTTLSMFVMISIKVKGSSTFLIYSCSLGVTSLSATALTKSISLLILALFGTTSLILDAIQQLWQPSGKIMDFRPNLKSPWREERMKLHWRWNKIREKCLTLNFGLNVWKTNFAVQMILFYIAIVIFL